jgi:hypothetical protein
VCDITVLDVHAPIEEKCDEALEHVFDQFHKQHVKILLGDFNAKVGGNMFSN